MKIAYLLTLVAALFVAGCEPKSDSDKAKKAGEDAAAAAEKGVKDASKAAEKAGEKAKDAVKDATK